MIRKITCHEFSGKIETYLKGRLDFIQEQRFIKHRKTCSRCNEEISTIFAEKAAEDGLGWIVNGGPEERFKHCLNSSTMLEYAKGQMTMEEREMVRDHMEVCSFCRGLVHAEIKVWEAEKVRRKSKRKEERTAFVER